MGLLEKVGLGIRADALAKIDLEAWAGSLAKAGLGAQEVPLMRVSLGAQEDPDGESQPWNLGGFRWRRSALGSGMISLVKVGLEVWTNHLAKAVSNLWQPSGEGRPRILGNLLVKAGLEA